MFAKPKKRKIKMVRACGKMPGDRAVKKMFMDTPEGRRSVGKPRKLWLDYVENDLKKVGVRG